MTDLGDIDITRAASLLASSRKAVAFTGAGVSTESGIPDFRSSTGLWSRYNPAEYGTLGAFLRNPAKVWKMLWELDGLLDARPNAGHEALAALEREGPLAGIITQNIDGLHQAAGSVNVIEYHGNGHSMTCLECGDRFTREQVRAMPRGDGLPRYAACKFKAGRPAGEPQRCIIKPDVILFDELIPAEAQTGAMGLLAGVDLLLVAGTSLEVFPASEIPRVVRAAGGRVIEINLEPARGLRPDILLQGNFTAVMAGLYRSWKNQAGRG